MVTIAGALVQPYSDYASKQVKGYSETHLDPSHLESLG